MSISVITVAYRMSCTPSYQTSAAVTPISTSRRETEAVATATGVHRVTVSQSDTEQQGTTDESGESERQQKERTNDPLTRSGTGAPRVSWQTTPEREG